MRVRMTVTKADPSGVLLSGSEYDLPKDFADSLEKAGAAIKLDPEPPAKKPETATGEGYATADQPTGGATRQTGASSSGSGKGGSKSKSGKGGSKSTNSG